MDLAKHLFNSTEKVMEFFKLSKDKRIEELERLQKGYEKKESEVKEKSAKLESQ